MVVPTTTSEPSGEISLLDIYSLPTEKLQSGGCAETGAASARKNTYSPSRKRKTKPLLDLPTPSTPFTVPTSFTRKNVPSSN